MRTGVWIGALAILAAVGMAQEPEPIKPPPPLPEDHGVDFGPYVHYYKSRAKADFTRQSKKIVGRLRGLNRPCPTCKRTGVVTVVIREAYYDAHHVWIPAIEDVRECPTCKGRKDLFNRGVARKFIDGGLPPESRASAHSEHTRTSLMRLLNRSHNSYRASPRMSSEIHGRYAIAKANTRDGIFPLQFRLVPHNRKFDWYLHDPAVYGAFDIGGEFKTLPGTARVEDVYAGDVIVLNDKRIVRLAGITIPGPDGKVLKGEQSLPDEVVRALVRSELIGKRIELAADKYAQFTCRGLPLAFVKLDGKDYGLSLVRRGLARRHPKHKTQFNKTYMDAEKQARTDKAGFWRRLLK